MVAPMIAGTIPEPRWIPKRGSNQLPIRAPTMPIAISATRPKPVPFTTWPASQPATRPTTKMMSNVSADMRKPPPCSSPHRESEAVRVSLQPVATHDSPIEAYGLFLRWRGGYVSCDLDHSGCPSGHAIQMMICGEASPPNAGVDGEPGVPQVIF